MPNISTITTCEIPFTLEQEMLYRQYFRDVLRQKNYQKRPFSYQTGVLVNMAVYELVKLGIDLFDDDIDAYIDFEFLSDHALYWLMSEECETYRLMIEEREEKITGTVSNSFDVIPLVRKKSKVLNEKGFDPARELTTKKAIELFEEEMKIYADVYDLDRRDFEQLAALEILISREKAREGMKMKEENPPRGFGKSSRS